MTETANGSHEQWESDVAAYALGALDDVDLRRFEEHLAVCAECRAELAQMREVVAALPASAPPSSPPPELKDRVMAVVEAEASEQAAAKRRPARRASWGGARTAVAAVAAAAAAVVVGVLALTGGASSVHTYAGIVNAQRASASVTQSGSTAQLRVAGLPPPPAGRIYQVWLQRGAQPPAPTRTLFATQNGSVTVSSTLHGVRTLLVTDEPRPNGSLAPTRTPLITVSLS